MLALAYLQANLILRSCNNKGGFFFQVAFIFFAEQCHFHIELKGHPYLYRHSDLVSKHLVVGCIWEWLLSGGAIYAAGPNPWTPTL